MVRKDRFANYQVFDRNTNLENFYASDWRLGIDYNINEDHFVYLYAATGSKAGAFGDGVDVCVAAAGFSSSRLTLSASRTLSWATRPRF